MKRLFSIGFSTVIHSLIPILSWFLLGLTISSEIANTFSIIYPIAFLSIIIVSIFGSGANIKGIKEKNLNSVPSGLILGTIVGAILFIPLCFLVKPYLNFMNMDYEIYHIFVLYSFIEMFISLIFQLIMQKYYYEDKDKKASIHTIIFNTINLVLLVGSSLITKNQIIIIVLPLVAIGIYTFILLIKQFKKFKLEFNILSNLKYTSNDIVSNLLMFFSYLFGYGNIFSFGIEYATAINFVTLITDTQWDACTAIETCAKIDIANDNFNFKKHLKNGFIYVSILIATILIAFFALFNLYNVTFSIGLYYLIFQIVDFILATSLYVASPFVQINHSPTKNTANELVAFFVRMLLSAFLPTVFCTGIGQITSTLISVVFYIYIFAKHYKINKAGFVENKEKKKLFKNLPKQ